MKLATLGAAALFAALSLQAQQPRFANATGTAPPAPPVDAVKTYLSLTDSQITGFQAVRQTARTAIATHR